MGRREYDPGKVGRVAVRAVPTRVRELMEHPPAGAASGVEAARDHGGSRKARPTQRSAHTGSARLTSNLETGDVGFRRRGIAVAQRLAR